MNSPEISVLAAILLCLGGAVATLLCARWRRVAGLLNLAVTLMSAVLVGVAVVHVLTHGPGSGATFMPFPKLGFALRLYVDGLSAVFLALAALIAVPAALYSVTYMDHYAEYGVGRYYPHFLVFLSAMYGLVSTTDMMWFFFIFWQLMTLPGYALIRFEHRRRENVQAANRYLWMMQLACAATMVGAAILATGGAEMSDARGRLAYDFDTVSPRLTELLLARPGLSTLAFALFLLGFGIKMGMWPFGVVWLPAAHPAAPSPISAMLSGVMIKTGVYGLLRYFLWLVPAEGRDSFPLAAWGFLIAGLGTITLLLGTWEALRQEQTKRLLAFHSIGQIGYILLGIGSALALLEAGPGAAPLAGLALFAALFHTVNHGIFKGLLFLNAGTLLFRSGTQDLNRLGGWFRHLPITGVTALLAAFAIAGVPPLNGFASKWTLYVTGVRGGDYVAYLPVCTVVAILTSALTLASFLKFFGASFLAPGRATPRPTEPLREVGGAMLIPQVFLAALCLVLGILPALGYGFLGRALHASHQGLGSVLADALPANTAPLAGLAWLPGQALLWPLALCVLLGLALLVAAVLYRLGRAGTRRVPRWQCGYVTDANTPPYSAHHYYGELKRVVGTAPRVPAASDTSSGAQSAAPAPAASATKKP